MFNEFTASKIVHGVRANAMLPVSPTGPPSPVRYQRKYRKNERGYFTPTVGQETSDRQYDEFDSKILFCEMKLNESDNQNAEFSPERLDLCLNCLEDISLSTVKYGKLLNRIYRELKRACVSHYYSNSGKKGGREWRHVPALMALKTVEKKHAKLNQEHEDVHILLRQQRQANETLEEENHILTRRLANFEDKARYLNRDVVMHKKHIRELECRVRVLETEKADLQSLFLDAGKHIRKVEHELKNRPPLGNRLPFKTRSSKREKNEMPGANEIAQSASSSDVAKLLYSEKFKLALMRLKSAAKVEEQNEVNK